MRQLLLSTVLLLSVFAMAQKTYQSQIDSMLVILPKMKNDTSKVNLLNEIAYGYRKTNPDSGLKYGNEALLLSEKLKFNDGIALSLRSISTCQLNGSDFEKPIKNLNRALQLTSNKKILMLLYRGLSMAYTYQNKNPEGLKYGNIALKLSEELHDKKAEAIALTNIGLIYFKLVDDKKALIYYEKSLKINEKLNDKSILTSNYINIGLSHSNMGNYQKAITFYDKALDLCNQTGNITSKGTLLDAKSQNYLYMKDFANAEIFAKQSLEINQQTENQNLIASNLYALAEVFLQKARVEKNQTTKSNFLNVAAQNINQSTVIKKELGSIELIAVNYETLSEIQKMQGNYKAALESYEQFKNYNDSIYNQGNKETVKNLEDQRTIDLAQRQIKINKLTLEAKEKQKWLFVAGIGFLVIIGGLLFYQSRKRKQINLKLEILNKNLDTKNLELDQANQIKTRFFSILNHDLRSPLYNLIHFLHLQKENPELLDESSKKRIEDRTISSAENLLVSMEDMLLWSKGQMENFKPQPKNLFVEQLFNDTKKVFSGYLKITFEYHNPENIAIFTDENYLKTIVRNLTSNAINAFTTTQNPTIVWKAWQKPASNGEKAKTFMSITDNGPGASKENFKALYDDTEVIGIKSGLGLHLIRDLAKAIDCEVTVESKVGEGTTFVLVFL